MKIQLELYEVIFFTSDTADNYNDMIIDLDLQYLDLRLGECYINLYLPLLMLKTEDYGA